MELPNDINETVIRHIQCSHAALDAAAAEREKTAQVQKQVADNIPAVIDLLIAHNRITPGEREKCAGVLADPVRSLAFLANLADPSKTVKTAQVVDPAALGNPSNPGKTKTAGLKVAGLTPSGKRPQDVAYERRLRGEA